MRMQGAMVALAVAMLGAHLAGAAIIPGTPYFNEPELYSVYNSLYGTNFASNSDINFLNLQVDGFQTLTLDPDVESMTFDALWRQSYLVDHVGYYTLDGSNNPDVLTQVLGPYDNTGPNSGQGQLTTPAVTVSTAGLSTIGFYDRATVPGDDNTGFWWYSQPGQNDGQWQVTPSETHMLLLTTPYADTYLMCFEDLPYTYYVDDGQGGQVNIGDRDYQDIVVQVTLNRTVVPEPSSMALMGLGLAGLALRKIRKAMLA